MNETKLEGPLFADDATKELIAQLTADIAAARQEVENWRTVEASAVELVELLRDKWACPNVDAMTLYFASFMAGFSTEWRKNPPKNGFTHSCSFPDSGRMEMEVRRVDGKSVTETIIEMSATLRSIAALVGLPETAAGEQVAAAVREALMIRLPYWRCKCGAVTKILKDETYCGCDIYEQEWSRVDAIPAPGGETL